MPAVPLISTKRVLEDGAILQVVVWWLPRPVPPSSHRYKYSLFYGRQGERIVGFDNEHGKGDHRHILGVESPYMFTTIDRLLGDFAAEVERVRGRPV